MKNFPSILITVSSLSIVTAIIFEQAEKWKGRKSLMFPEKPTDSRRNEQKKNAVIMHNAVNEKDCTCMSRTER